VTIRAQDEIGEACHSEGLVIPFIYAMTPFLDRFLCELLKTLSCTLPQSSLTSHGVQGESED